MRKGTERLSTKALEPRGAGGGGKESFTKKAAPYAYIAPTLIIMGVLMVVPICMVISYSFYDNVITNQSPVLVGFANYQKLLGDKNFFDAVQHTLTFVGLSVVFHMLIAITFAMMLNSKLVSIVTRSIFRVIYILPWVFTAAIVATLWRLIMNPNGVLNYILDVLGFISTKVEWMSSKQLALYSLTFVNIWAGYPFFMVSILAGLQGISGDLYEAATVDGANGPQKFFFITIPQLRPILISMAMLDCIWTTQQFSLVWMTTGGGPVNATDLVGTFTYRLAFKNYQFALASTSGVLILIVVMILAFIYVRNQKVGD